MKAGWALQAQKHWAEAVPRFEAALKVFEADQRALSELGWSAMNAGDFAKARKADEQAVRVALDPKVKAAALYNLGLVEEKTGDNAGALKSFTASIKLRPNKTVEQEITKLGAARVSEPSFCAAGEKPCDCVWRDAFGQPEQAEPPSCDLADVPALPVKAFHAYTVKQPPWQWTYLLDEHNQLVAKIAGGLDRTRVYEDITLDKAELKSIAGHQVLWLQIKDTAHETMGDSDNMSMYSDETVAVTVCVVGDATTPTRCPLRDVPLSHLVDKDGAPTVTTLDVALDGAGTVTVKLVKGASSPAIDPLMGPHKLW